MSSKKTRSGLRLWPAYLILALSVGFFVWAWASPDLPLPMSRVTVSIIATACTLILLLVWWLLLSRARWYWRLGVLAGVVALGWAAGRFLEVRGVSGDLVPQVAWRTSPTPAPPEILPSPPPLALPTPAPPVDVEEAVRAETEGGVEPSPSPTEADEVEPELKGSVPVDSRGFPQFLGPNRNARLTDRHLVSGWDERPPVEVWRHSMGTGWSGFVVSNGLAVTQEQRDGREHVVAYDLDTGRLEWSHKGGPGYEDVMTGNGPRATPTLDGGRVYAFGVRGVLSVLDLQTGRLLFEKNVVLENSGRSPVHGVAASPLVVDGNVIVVAGGPGGRSLVAYDAETGERRWSGGDDGAGYSSPIVATLAGVRQIVVFNHGGLTGHDPGTGEVLWQDPWPDRDEKVAQPVILGDDRVFASMGYGIGSRMVRIVRGSGGSLRADVLWRSRRLKAKFTQVVEHGGFLYGLDEGVMVCLDPETGERRWKRGRYGHGQVLLVDDVLLVQTEDGEVALIDPNPEELTEIARFPAVEGKAWATPALAGDLLIVRSDIEAACYRLPTESGA